MESTPAGIELETVRSALQALTCVKEAHDLHIWTVSSGRLALSVHLIVEANEPDRKSVLSLATELLETKYNIVHTTIQIEDQGSFQSERCYDCV
jgi:cobalt-zinc-cadmium efflux system protein